MSDIYTNPYINIFKYPALPAPSSEKTVVTEPVKLDSDASLETPVSVSAPQNEPKAKKKHTARNIIIVGSLVAAAAALIVGFKTGKIKLPHFKAKPAPAPVPVPPAKPIPDAGSGIAAVTIGLIAACAKEAQNGEDKKIAELRKSVLDNEAYIKNEELPFIDSESKEYFDDYYDSVTKKIAASIQYVNKFYRRYDMDMDLYNQARKNLDAGLIDANGMTTFEQNKKDGTVVMELFNKDVVKTQRVTLKDDKIQEIEIFDVNTGNVRAKGHFSHNADGSHYLSQYFLYNKETQEHIGTILCNELRQPKGYLRRQKQGGKNGVFYKINPETSTLKGINIIDDSNKGCIRQYDFDASGILTKAALNPSHDMAKRIYNYKEGKPESVDVFGKEKDVTLHVPFETAQS